MSLRQHRLERGNDLLRPLRWRAVRVMQLPRVDVHAGFGKQSRGIKVVGKLLEVFGEVVDCQARPGGVGVHGARRDRDSQADDVHASAKVGTSDSRDVLPNNGQCAELPRLLMQERAHLGR